MTDALGPQFEEARSAWQGDLSMEMTDAAVKLAGAPKHWVDPGYSVPEDHTHLAKALMGGAQPFTEKVWHGTANLAKLSPGEEFHVPLMATSPKRGMAEEFSRTVRDTPEGEASYPDYRLYEFHGGRGARINDSEVAVTGRYKVAEVHKRRVVLHPAE